MPPKKRLKLINNQQKITTLLAKCSGFEPESAFDRRPSDDHVADTGGADADGLEQAEETDSTNTSDPKQPDTGAQSNTDSHSQLEPNSGDSKRKFQERWSKIWPWLVFRDNKMFCSVCTKSGMQNTFTAGCETFKTSSMKRHEETADHRGAMASDNLKSCMQVAIKNVHSEHDKALIKAMKTVYWLASENLPLSKYESLMLLEKELEVPSLDCLKKFFPQKTLIDSFYVLAMRTINFEADLEEYGVNEIDDLLKYYGEEQVHKDTTSVPVLQKGEVKRQWRTAKQIVKSAKYPVDNMQNLWCLLVKHHQDELSELLKLVYIALTLPLHTANCERVFSQQNQILTKRRNRLSPVFSDKLLKVRMEGKGLHDHDFQATVNKWHANKNRKFKH